jgi:hypothetical protein
MSDFLLSAVAFLLNIGEGNVETGCKLLSRAFIVDICEICVIIIIIIK